jgi:AhpD family alkylhydroperoxidase
MFVIAVHPKNTLNNREERNYVQTKEVIKARMNNPAMIIPDAMQALLALGASVKKAGVPSRTLDLVYLRASQINGCSVCVDMHSRDLKKAGETDERLFAVVTWRDNPCFTDTERAALALSEAVTRLSDRPDPVPNEIWEEAARHYDEHALAALIIAIANINVWNRLNVTVRQVVGQPPGVPPTRAIIRSRRI